MQLSFITVVLASLSVAVLAQIEADDPVYMNKRGEIIPASNVPRSQYEAFVKRQIDESIPVKTDSNGNVVPYGKRQIDESLPVKTDNGGNVVPFKRSAEPIILEVLPGTDLHQPVKMDVFGNIISAQ